jgi:hypothetical protein
MRIISDSFGLRPRSSKSPDIVLRNYFALPRKQSLQSFADALVLLGGQFCLQTRNIAVRNPLRLQLHHCFMHDDISVVTSYRSGLRRRKTALSKSAGR